MLSADTPARAKVLNCTLFNGYFGCTYCLHPGVNIGRKPANIRYPFLKDIKRRTHEQVIADALKVVKAREKGEEVDALNGVKGPSPLLMFKDFDLVKGQPVDYMHAALHGLVALLAECWFDSKNHNEKFYIGRGQQIKQINKDIKMIRPPKCFTRQPRPISDRGYYEASEELTLLLHFVAACLDSILAFNKTYK